MKNLISIPSKHTRASLIAQLKNPPAVRETWVRSLHWEDPLEKGKATHRLPTSEFWPGEFHGLYSPWDRRELYMTERLSLHFFYRVVLLFSQPRCMACSFLVSWPRIEPSSPTVEEQSTNHSFLKKKFVFLAMPGLHCHVGFL